MNLMLSDCPPSLVPVLLLASNFSFFISFKQIILHFPLFIFADAHASHFLILLHLSSSLRSTWSPALSWNGHGPDGQCPQPAPLLGPLCAEMTSLTRLPSLGGREVRACCWGLQSPPIQLPVARSGQACLVKPSQYGRPVPAGTRKPAGPLPGNSQEVKLDVTQVLLPVMQP